MAVGVFLIDDDLAAARDVQAALAREGYLVDHALPGRNAIRQILIDEPDLVILSTNIADGEWQFCRRLLTFLDAPLLLLLPSGDKMDRVKGLNMGADACLFRPVLMPELLAVARALLRQDLSADSRRQRNYFVDGDLVADLTRQEVRLNDEPVALSAMEFRVLASLIRHRDEVLSHELLQSEVWGSEQTERYDTIKQYIHHLRQKLEPDPGHPQRIVTRRGQGYMLQSIQGQEHP